MTTRNFARRSALFLTPLVVLAGWAGPAQAAAPPVASAPLRATAMLPTHSSPGLKDCGMGAAAVKPKSLIIACADANTVAKDIAWSKWGPSGAAAKGTVTWNSCVPYCAASKKWYSSPAQFTLSKVVHTAHDGWLFEELTVHLTGKDLHGMERSVTYREAPVR